MKQRIKLTESSLQSIIKESVRRVLNESCWYGDTEPFRQIMQAASKIRQDYEYANSDDYDPWDDCDGRDLSYDLYAWAKKVEHEAEEWIRYNSSNTSINGGENW